MPKTKTKRAAAKRFEETGSGKIRRRHSYKSHILTKKPRDRKRDLAKAALVDNVDVPRVRKMISA